MYTIPSITSDLCMHVPHTHINFCRTYIYYLFSCSEFDREMGPAHAMCCIAPTPTRGLGLEGVMEKRIFRLFFHPRTPLQIKILLKFRSNVYYRRPMLKPG